jgi:hypothetical protein
VKPAAGYQSLACSSPEAVQTTGTVAVLNDLTKLFVFDHNSILWTFSY